MSNTGPSSLLVMLLSMGQAFLIIFFVYKIPFLRRLVTGEKK